MPHKRPYHHGDLRDALLDAAERKVNDHGVDQLSLRELARTVGVSHAAPRTHFPDRRTLLDALAQRGFARLDAELRNGYETAAPTLDARLRATIGAFVAFSIQSPPLIELMFAAKRTSNDPQLQSNAAQALSITPRLVDEAITAGELAPANLDRYTLLLAATIRGIAEIATSEPIDPDAVDKLISDAVTTFIHGNAPAPESSPDESGP
jgi:AcrR family transcriptional regulator